MEEIVEHIASLHMRLMSSFTGSGSCSSASVLRLSHPGVILLSEIQMRLSWMERLILEPFYFWNTTSFGSLRQGRKHSIWSYISTNALLFCKPRALFPLWKILIFINLFTFPENLIWISAFLFPDNRLRLSSLAALNFVASSEVKETVWDLTPRNFSHPGASLAAIVAGDSRFGVAAGVLLADVATGVATTWS